MEKAKRGVYARVQTGSGPLVKSGQTLAAAARSLGMVDQTLHNWVQAERQGRLRGAEKKAVSVEQNGDQPVTRRVGGREDGARHPGKSDGVLRERAEMKYALIRCHRSFWPIGIQCGVLQVSVSGYHEHFARQRRIAERRHLSAEALTVHIQAVYRENRGAYGWPRVWRQLKAQGLRVGKQRVQRLMQQQGLRARGRRRFRVTTTDSRHDLPIAPHRRDR